MKRPFRPKDSINFGSGRLLLKLHLPPPLARSLTDGRLSRSASSTFFPHSAAANAAESPAGPLPQTTISY